MTAKTFLPKKGNYRDRIAFQKTECIYDITYYFAHKFLQKGDRTIDQMIQAARSGRQNIAEGSAAGVTSAETELKLINVAKASLQERNYCQHRYNPNSSDRCISSETNRATTKRLCRRRRHPRTNA